MIPRTRSQQQKEEVRRFLAVRDTVSLINWADTDRDPLRIMASLLFDEDPLICWRAIEGMGQAAGVVAEKDRDRVVRQVGRLLWMMNDESGGLCRRSPEAIAEILVNVPDLIPEYAHMLTAYLWEEPFECGTRLAMQRLLTTNRKTVSVFAQCVGDLQKSLEHPDECIRGASLLMLKAMQDIPSAPRFAIPSVSPVRLSVYDFAIGELIDVELGN